MSRFTVLLFSLLFLLSMSACNGTNGSAGAGANGSAATVSLSGAIGGEITVSCYDSARYKQSLEEAARLFEEKYPGTTVHVETFSAMPEIQTGQQNGKTTIMVTREDDPQSRADYISRTNTALMSGEGADILAMDVLPVQKYAESGQLENLAAYMEADPEFKRTDYRENILEAVEYKNGIWFLPMDYSFNYYAYDSTLLPSDTAAFGTGNAFTTTQLLELGIASFDGSTMLFNMPNYTKGAGNDLWSRLLSENYTSFVDLENKTAHFDDGSFAALLESTKEYGERGYIPKGVTGQTDAGTVMRQIGDTPTERYYFKPKNILALIIHFNQNSDSEKQVTMSMGSATAGIETDDEIAGIQANANGSVPFSYNQAYAINSGSQNKETAWAFLKFLLGEEMQLSASHGAGAARGLPLHNDSRSQYMELLLSTAFGQRGPVAAETGLANIPPEVLEQFNEAIEQFSDLINSWEIKDTTVNDMIAAEVQYFFDGSKTAGQVAEVLQNKVNLYLNE